MTERRVRTQGRQTYGRAMPLRRPERRRRMPALGPLQKRLLILAIGAAVAVWATFKMVTITKITVTSPGRAGEIKAEAQRIIDDSWQQRNLITFDTGDFIEKLQAADPLVRSVEVRRKWLHGISINTVLKQPSMGWSTGNQNYLLDVDGTAIGALPAGSKLPVVVDGSNLPVQLGQRVASVRFVEFVTKLVPALAAAGITPTSIDVKDTTLDLTVATNKGYRLVFDTSREVGDEMTDLRSVLALLASQKKAPSEYIDLRISGKAYYK